MIGTEAFTPNDVKAYTMVGVDPAVLSCPFSVRSTMALAEHCLTVHTDDPVGWLQKQQFTNEAKSLRVLGVSAADIDRASKATGKAKEMVERVCRITNLYQYDWLDKAQERHVGLFPVISILNHSCDPNCIFMSGSSELALLSLRPIKAGEALTVSYNRHATANRWHKQLARAQLFLMFDGLCRCGSPLCVHASDTSESIAKLLQSVHSVPDDDVARTQKFLAEANRGNGVCKTIFHDWIHPLFSQFCLRHRPSLSVAQLPAQSATAIPLPASLSRDEECVMLLERFLVFYQCFEVEHEDTKRTGSLTEWEDWLVRKGYSILQTELSMLEEKGRALPIFQSPIVRWELAKFYAFLGSIRSKAEIVVDSVFADIPVAHLRFALFQQ